MGENFKFNHWIFLPAIVAFFLTSVTIILCVLLLTIDDEECSSIVHTDDRISEYLDIYTCNCNPCKNNGRCFTTKVEENCTCPIGYSGRICNDPASIKVKLHSQNVCNSNISCPPSSITINGSLMNVTEPGLTFVIVNATTGKQLESRRFEIRPGQTSWDNITRFLTYLPIELIILMVFAQNGSSNYIHQTIPILALTLNNQLPKDMSRVSSWALAGYKGALGVSWTTSIKCSPDMGSANVTLSIPIVGVGQDCRQCEPTSCLNIINGFACECASGYTGTTCTQVESIKICSDVQVQCYNGGRCVYAGCHSCPSGYNGTFCAEPKKMNVSLLAPSPRVASGVNNSSITANGTVYSEINHGITFVIINATSGQLFAQQHFKSDLDNNYTTNHSAITSFVNGLPQEVYVLSVMQRVERKSFNSLVKLILKERLLEDIILPVNDTMVYSWALVMYNGVFNISRPIIFVRTSLNRSAVIDTSITITGLDGTCSNQLYKCQCGPGYAGIACAGEFDAGCEVLKPCRNNGTCSYGTKGYTCSCRPGFKGKNCETIEST